MSITELDIIKTVMDNITYRGDVVKGIGDDCAVFKLGNTYLTVTTDMMFRSTHFPDILTPFQIGMRVITATVSDICAMCARPLGIVVSMGLPTVERGFLLELIKGIDYACRKYSCPIVGGDTNRGKELILCGTAIGVTDNPVYRGGKVGEDIMVTYDIGRVYCALEILKMKEKGVISRKTFYDLWEEYPNIMKKLVEPIARVREGLLLNKYVSSCCDISDGLKKELFYIGNFEISSKKLLRVVPKDVIEFCDRFQIDPIHAALNSGEEFELLFTTKRCDDIFEVLRSECEGEAKKIGKVIEEGYYIDGEELEFGGYIHSWE